MEADKARSRKAIKASVGLRYIAPIGISERREMVINVGTSFKKAVNVNQQQRNRLLERSIQDQSGLADGLAPVGNTPIKVYLTESGLIKEVSRNPKAIGTVMRDSTGYLIFIDKENDLEIKSVCGNLALRFIVLHEYAHIIHRNVFEDRDNVEKAKILTFTPEELSEYWCTPDKFANRYATSRLHLELSRRI